MSVALIEIMVGAVAGNLIGLPLTPWVNFLAGFGAILLTFLAGTEIDRRSSAAISGRASASASSGFLALSRLLLAAHYLLGWPWPQAQIAGISLSTTSVAVVYAVMVETGFNRTETRQDHPRGLLHQRPRHGAGARHRVRATTISGSRFSAPRPPSHCGCCRSFAPWFFARSGIGSASPRPSLCSLVLFCRSAALPIAGSEAVLPAYLVGMALAPAFMNDPELPHRMRIIAFTILTPVLLPEGRLAGRAQRGHRRQPASSSCFSRSRW